MAVFDRYDYYYDKAMEAYCSNKKINPKDINLCFGPIEATIYGVTKDNKYYKEDTFPACLGDDELDHEYRIISKSEMLEAINNNIKFCEANGADVIAEALKLEKVKIE